MEREHFWLHSIEISGRKAEVHELTGSEGSSLNGLLKSREEEGEEGRINFRRVILRRTAK